MSGWTGFAPLTLAKEAGIFKTNGLDVFVTHDIEEAIFLATRVLVMSARPGRIKTELAVDLPHPHHYTVKTSPEFSALKARLTEDIRAEAMLAAAH